MNTAQASMLVTLALVCCPSAYANPTREIEPPAAASASARRAWVPSEDVPPPSNDESSRPSNDEWRTASEATEVRVTDPGCKATRVREWYRIQCAASHVGLVGGTRTNLDVGRQKDDGSAWLIFPARRGDRRMAAFTRYAKYGMVVDTLVSEQWLEGDPEPMITVIGAI